MVPALPRTKELEYVNNNGVFRTIVDSRVQNVSSQCISITSSNQRSRNNQTLRDSSEIPCNFILKHLSVA